MSVARGSLQRIGVTLTRRVRRPSAQQPHQHAGRRHVGAAEVEPVGVDPGRVELPVELEGGGDVADRAQRQPVDRERRQQVGLAPGARKLLGLGLEQGSQTLHAVEIDHRDVGAHQPVEQKIALQRRPLLAVQQHQRDLEAELPGRCGHLPAPVGLGVGAGNDGIAPCARTSANTNSSWRVLLPPKPSPVRSSRLSQISGPPSAAPAAGKAPAGSADGQAAPAAGRRSWPAAPPARPSFPS